MLQFAEFSNLSTVFSENNVNKLIVALAADTLAECQAFRSLTNKFPDLTNKFATVSQGKKYNPGDFIKVQTDSGCVIFFLIIRGVEKFQPYIFDITKALDKVISYISKEAPNNTSNSGGVIILLPSSEELKLSDAILIPTVANSLSNCTLNIFLFTNGEQDDYISKIENGIITYKPDSWKSDWMLTLDDILLVDIINNIQIACHDFKISKSNLVRCYYICNQHGMFPKLEFYDTEYGKFFKMFLPKSSSLINHGLLLNTHQYYQTEPKKFSCILGPNFPHLMNIAYTQIMSNRAKTMKIVAAIKQDHIELAKQRREQQGQQGQQQNTFNNNSNSRPQTSTSFQF